MTPGGIEIPIKNSLLKKGCESYFEKQYGADEYLEPCMTFFPFFSNRKSNMMKLFGVAISFLFSIPIIVFSASNTPGKWIKINPSVTSQSLRCSFFINPAIGWAGGRNGCILHTTDSGNTWKIQQTPRNCWINSIYFHDTNEGWAVGRYGSLYTTNGGRKWFQRNIGNDSMIPISKILFLNRNIGWLIFNSKLAYTDDGGKTWTDRMDSVDKITLNDIVFINDSLGFLCANRYLARTENGGKEWMKVDSAAIIDIMPIKTIQMIDTLAGYCLGWFGISKTIDGGKTWKKNLFVGSGARFEVMHFSCIDTGFALFGFGPMYVFRTNDGGATWSNRPLQSVIMPIMSINFPERQKGIGTADNGAIYRILGAGDSIFEITMGTGNDVLNCIDFGSEMHGFAGTGSLFFGDSALLYSSDGGSTWNKKPTPLKAIASLLCFDSNTIILHGMDSSMVRMTMRTTNRGFTWTNSGEFDDDISYYRIRNMPQAAYLFKENEKALYLTSDAGITWVKKGQIPMDTINGQPANNRVSFYFFNADTGIAMSNVNMYRTSDGGYTWDKIPNSIPGDLVKNDIYFCSPKVGWVVGSNSTISNSPRGIIFKTDNGGLTWREQENLGYFPDYYIAPTGKPWNIFIKIYAKDDGKEAWVLDNASGILHTDDGGEHWVQDTIPASPGLVFTDLAYNKYDNTLWLTSEFFGIWKYAIPPENTIKNPSTAVVKRNVKKVINTNNGIIVPLQYSSDKISIGIFDISGRLVFSKTFRNTQKRNSIYMPLFILSSGYYIGNIQYYSQEMKTIAVSFNVNIFK